MYIGKLQSKAPSVLSTFVLACSIVTVGLLFVMQKAEQTRQALADQGDYSAYYTD
jgi:hypothetical protein